MTIKIEIVEENASLAVQNLIMLANTFTRGIAPPKVESPPTQPDLPKAESKPEPKADEKPKTTRAKKEDKAPEPKQTDLEDKIAETKAEKQAVPPIEDVRAALQALAKSKGDDAVYNLLGQFNSKNASGIPEDRRADLLAEVNKLVEG